MRKEPTVGICKETLFSPPLLERSTVSLWGAVMYGDPTPRGWNHYCLRSSVPSIKSVLVLGFCQRAENSCSLQREAGGLGVKDELLSFSKTV